MKLHALIPIKTISLAKSRLADALTETERKEFVIAMIQDVLHVLGNSPGLDGIAVATSDPLAAMLAEGVGARVISEGADRGYVGAVDSASRILVRDGAHAVMTVPLDVPLLTPSDVAAVLQVFSTSRCLTLVPAHDHLGTNCVVLPAHSPMPLKFGFNSFSRHLIAARENGLQARVVSIPHIALDIDTPADLAEFAACGSRTRAAGVLQRSSFVALPRAS